MTSNNNQTNTPEGDDVTSKKFQKRHQVSKEPIFQQQQMCKVITVRHQTRTELLLPLHARNYGKDLQQHAQIHHADNIQQPAIYPEEQSPQRPATKTQVFDFCEKKFNPKRSLVIHQVLHTGVMPYVCNVCQKGFTQKRNLQIHYLIHTGEKPHVCKLCNKGFTTKSHLQIHYLIHTGEKPHVCKVCNKCFTVKSNLQKHCLIHTGVKPYICDVCHKGFTQTSHLQRHYLTHTGEKPHLCVACKKSFAEKRELRNHSCIHTGQKPLVGDVCQKRFFSKKSLRKHNLTLSTGKKEKGLKNKGGDKKQENQINIINTELEPVLQEVHEAGKDQQQREVERNRQVIHAPKKLDYIKATFEESSGLNEYALIPTDQQQGHFENTQPLPTFHQTFSHMFRQNLNNGTQTFISFNEIDQDTAHFRQEEQQRIRQ